MDTTRTVDAAYLVVGAGAMGMAFVDTLLTYPFVRLHQPSAYYGVNSRALGTDAIDEHGWNVGFYELATGGEVSVYYDQLMRHQLLPTGRLAYHRMARYLGAATSFAR